MIRGLRSLVIYGGLLSALVAVADGQAAAINGEITGVVTEASGVAVLSAVVQVVNTATSLTAATKTENSGLYRFTLLPIGKYDLKVQVSGFADARLTAINVSAGAALIGLQAAPLLYRAPNPPPKRTGTYATVSRLFRASALDGGWCAG